MDISFELRRKFPAGGFTSHIKKSTDGRGLAVKLCELIDSDDIDFTDYENNYVTYVLETDDESMVRFGKSEEVMCPINPYNKPPDIVEYNNGVPSCPSNGYSLKLDIYFGGSFTETIYVFKDGIQVAKMKKKFFYGDFLNPGQLVNQVYKDLSFIYTVPDEDPIQDEEPEHDVEPDIPAPDVKPIVTGIFNNLKKIINEFVNENKRWFFAGVFIAGFVFHWIIF